MDNNRIVDSIGESYYSIYHAAIALLKLKNINPRTHSGLISEFGLNFVKDGTIGEDYARALVKAKNQKDYGRL